MPDPIVLNEETGIHPQQVFRDESGRIMQISITHNKTFENTHDWSENYRYAYDREGRIEQMTIQSTDELPLCTVFRYSTHQGGEVALQTTYIWRNNQWELDSDMAPALYIGQPSRTRIHLTLLNDSGGAQLEPQPRAIGSLEITYYVEKNSEGDTSSVKPYERTRHFSVGSNGAWEEVNRGESATKIPNLDFSQLPTFEVPKVLEQPPIITEEALRATP